MKKMSVVFMLILFTVIISGCSNSMLKNSETGNLGPSWDTTMKLPVSDSSNNFGDLVGANKFQEFDLTITENEEVFFTIKGDDEPIEIEKQKTLPPLELTTSESDSISFEETIPVLPVYTGSENIEIPFPFNGITFADNSTDYNELKIKVENTGNNPVDSFNITIYDGNNNQLFSKDYSKDPDDQKVSDTINFDGKKIDYNNLNMEISYDQSEESGDSEISLNISGLNKLKITKAENISGTPGDMPLDFDVSLAELGDIQAPESGEAKFILEFITPNFNNFDFDFSNVILNDNQTFTKIEKNKFEYTNNEKIEFGQLSVDGSLNVEDNFSYDSSQSIGVKAKIYGNKTFGLSELDQEMDFDIEGNDLVYKTEGLKVDITQDQIDNINKYILSEDSYLKTEVLNSLPVGIQGDIYLANSNGDSIDESILYTEGNKVNTNSIIEIKKSDGDQISSENAFSLADKNGEDGFLTKIEEAAATGDNVFIGFKFNIGDTEDDLYDDGENTDGDSYKKYSFSDEQIIETKAHLAITVKVNQ
ncbi:MAG: hypothetical protein ACQEQD_07595 [Bacillota bacterium]